MVVKDGWVKKDRLVDNDNNLRFQDATQLRYINQLPKLKNAGFYGKGDFDVDTESIIQSGNITSVDRPVMYYQGLVLITYNQHYSYD